jgi:hypothetical protein
LSPGRTISLTKNFGFSIISSCGEMRTVSILTNLKMLHEVSSLKEKRKASASVKLVPGSTGNFEHSSFLEALCSRTEAQKSECLGQKPRAGHSDCGGCIALFRLTEQLFLICVLTSSWIISYRSKQKFRAVQKKSRSRTPGLSVPIAVPVLELPLLLLLPQSLEQSLLLAFPLQLPLPSLFDFP